MLAVRDLTRMFGSRTALDGVDIELRRGEVLVLLGDNGAGKTTLLNILAGRDRADSGKVMVSGSGGAPAPLRPGSLRAALSAGIAMVDADDTLAANLTALENIMLGVAVVLAAAAVPPESAQESSRELMRGLDMNVDLNARVAKLAAGDRLRVKLLRAIFGEPRVLMLDEPTNALTAQEAEALFATLKRLASFGLAVIVSTRKADEAYMPGGHVVILRSGHKVRRHPQHRGTRRHRRADVGRRAAKEQPELPRHRRFDPRASARRRGDGRSARIAAQGIA